MEQKTKEILDILAEEFPSPKSELVFKNQYQLLVAVILSAQCTDKRVNQVTPLLFAEADTPQKMADLPDEKLEKLIYSCGFYKNKARFIKEMPIEARIQKVQKQAQTGGDKQAKVLYDVLLRYKEALEQGKSARTVQFESKDEQRAAHDLFLLTSKPVLYVCNVDEASAVTGNQYVEQVREAIREEGADLLVVAAKIESEIAELETYDERQMFLEEIGLEESGVNRLIKAAYKLLNLETFITAGEMEVKAWTFHKGWKAPQCAGVIHTDFEKGFIRAEVIKYEDFLTYGSEAAVREAGKLNVEGKDYVVQDGDIMHFRFNV